MVCLNKAGAFFIVFMLCSLQSNSQNLLESNNRKFEELFSNQKYCSQNNAVIYVVGDIVDISKLGPVQEEIFMVTKIKKKYLTTSLAVNINGQYFDLPLNGKVFDFRRFQLMCNDNISHSSGCKNVVLKIRCYCENGFLKMLIIENVMMQLVNCNR